MIFVKNNRDTLPVKLSKALLGDPSPSEKNNDSFDFNRTNFEINKFKKPQIKHPTEKLTNFAKSSFSKTNYMAGNAKNNSTPSLYITGCTPYNPYLIDACKHAIIHIKKDLPNYQEVINKINNEFGIEENEKPPAEFSGYYTCRSFSNNNKIILPKIQNLTINTSFTKFSKNLKTDFNDNDIQIKDNSKLNNKDKKKEFDRNINDLKKSK